MIPLSSFWLDLSGHSPAALNAHCIYFDDSFPKCELHIWSAHGTMGENTSLYSEPNLQTGQVRNLSHCSYPYF